MKYTNYDLSRFAREDKGTLIYVLNDNKLAGKELTSTDVNLIKCILLDVEDVETLTGDTFTMVDKEKVFKNFPKSIVADYMESLGYECNFDSPISDEYLKVLNGGIFVAPMQSTQPPVQQPVQQQQQLNTTTSKVAQIVPDVNYTILQNGSIKEGQIDDEIRYWYNLYNTYTGDPTTQNLIIKLRSLIPMLKSREQPGKHSVYQIVNYISPTDFLLAEVGQGQNQILIQNGNVIG